MMAHLAQLDLAHTGLNRTAYWAADALLSRRGVFSYGIMADGKLSSFIYARSCEQGPVRIGPLYAADYSQARQLLHKMINGYARRGTIIAEVFGSNKNGQKVFEEFGWKYAGLSYHRMWLYGKVPNQQREGGRGVEGMYAIFDAASGYANRLLANTTESDKGSPKSVYYGML
jgi:hypothetical protein